MQILNMAMPFLMVLLSCYLLKYLCDQFEIGAGFLGRNMPAGVKGATINALGSSMPEMFTVIACLFFYNDPQMVLVGLGVTAGSAIFNSCVIPALSVLLSGNTNPVSLNLRALLRDIFWVLVAECTLVYILGTPSITFGAAIVLISVYVVYALHLYIDCRASGDNEVEDYEDEFVESTGLVPDLFKLNIFSLVFANRSLDTRTAIVGLLVAVVGIAGASHLLVEGVVGSADILGIPAFISAMVLGAAASSIPDLLLSVKDARKGNLEDAVANPLGSNTFDTTVALALPLAVWMMINGVDALPLAQDETLTMLRISIIAVTIAVASGLLFKHKAVTKSLAWFLLVVFGTWVGFVVYLMA